ncbi:MAG: ABC transporter ATP-binding protein, partial [Clostridia bacterium]|nr:ABC transporter ATP-binding protein [Clostridia bacterium]
SLTAGLIVKCGVLYLILRLIDTAANYYMASIGHVMGTKMETDMRRDFFGHLQKLSFSYYDNAKIGTLMSRLTSDLFDVTEFAHHCPEEFFIAGVKIIGSFVILLVINPVLALVTFAMIPVMILVLISFNGKMKEAFRQSRSQVGELNSQVEDSLLGIHEVKAFANEPTEIEKFRQGNTKFLGIKGMMYKYMGMFQASTRFFEGLLYIVVVVIGALLLTAQNPVLKLNAADYIAFLMYVSTLFTSVRRIVEFTEQFQRGMTGIERFSEILDVVPDIQDKPGAKVLENVKGDIVLDKVTFRYEEDKKQNVLTDLSLHVRAGENVALVGPSGCGKTTLCSLIPRFYEVQSGEILLDGVNVQDVTMRSLRQNIGIVQQNVYLFSGTIRENIAYGKPDATDEEIIAAAKLAGADEFIDELPDGYNTYVGERGIKLSGGQRQRVSIARVFLKNPPVLILDEATSALDNESERLVQASIEKLTVGRTTITIAHRLTTIKNADRIVVLTTDGIVEEGTHKELTEKGGMYADLYKLYTAD